jgi:SHS2 domain-containing protein
MAESLTDAPKQCWEHFSHAADIGVRGYGSSMEEAFAQGALALTAIVTDINLVQRAETVQVTCACPDNELLFVDWLNAVIYEMVTRNMLFSRFRVAIDGGKLRATLDGEAIDRDRHEPAVEPKGATYTELKVERQKDGRWMAQCIIDV